MSAINYISLYEPKSENWEEIFRERASSDPDAKVRSVAVTALAKLAIFRHADEQIMRFLNDIASDANEEAEVRDAAIDGMSCVELVGPNAGIDELCQFVDRLLESGGTDKSTEE